MAPGSQARLRHEVAQEVEQRVGLTDGDGLGEALRSVLVDPLDDPTIVIDGLQRLSGGASRETWAFDVRQGDGQTCRLVLRRDPPAAVRADGDMSREASAIEAAARRGVPVPRVVLHSDSSDLLGTPFMVMTHVDGETRPRRILRNPEYGRLRPRLAERCGEILAGIHAVDPTEIDGLKSADSLQSLREDLDRYSNSSPAFELAMRWLEENRPSHTNDAVVHGDFRNGNLLVGPEDIRAVLDWEVVHRGDPMEDLGYLCARAWRFRVFDKPVGGFGDYADLFRGYERVAGVEVDPSAVRWWELYSCVRWGVGCMSQAWRFLSGAEQSVELAAIGRRVWEQEYDVLLHLRELAEAA
ncbi:phosphotransferase family protein [Aeromicrobium sp. CF4.19]|uniref:phosphotransferase family protein n=1 Tax=Aeromicrobium sp. CF4.19 TaxID=3373082 RepID=UPI003EE5778A